MVLGTLDKIEPIRGTPFFGDADGIMKTVQSQYLNGGYDSAQAALDDAAKQIELATGLPIAAVRAEPPPGPLHAARARLTERIGMRTRTAVAYGFLAPYLLVFVAFWIWPIINSFYLSFLATRGVPWRFSPRSPGAGSSSTRPSSTRSRTR